jgi:glycerol uptake facilitator-like aquaporin
MALVGALTPLRAVLLTFAQVLGGITGAAIVHAILPGMSLSEDAMRKGRKLMGAQAR